MMAGHSTGRREQRRTEAQQRAELRASRTPLEQLVELDRKLGKGVGAKRERARLQRQIRGAA